MKPSRRSLILNAAATSLLASCATTTPPPAIPEAELDALLEAQRRALHIPALSFVAVIDGRLAYARAFGQRDLATQAPNTPDTLFPIGSATKSFTAYATCVLQDANYVRLDDRPQTFLPYLQLTDLEAQANITLRDMLCHRVGLMSKNDLCTVDDYLTREEYIRIAGSAHPTARFRERFQYSNVMFTAAGEAIARAHNTSWEELIAQRVFAPLGMRESAANLHAVPANLTRATGYTYNPSAQDWIVTPPTLSLNAMAPAGSIACSANDIAKWLVMLANSGAIRRERFISENAFREMITPQIEAWNDVQYALGWATYDWNGNRVVEHNGGGAGVSAIVSFIPERRCGFALLSNTSPHSLTTIGNAAKLLYPLLLGAPAETPATPSPQPTPPPETAPQRPRNLTPRQLIARMIRAAGGERTLRRHITLRLEGRKHYLNQGVSGPLTVLARAPASQSNDERWITPAPQSREYARLRIYFDGEHGGQETSFGQDATYDDATNATMRRANSFQPLLELATLYDGFDLSIGPPVMEEATYALALVKGDHAEDTLYISQTSHRILRRQGAGVVTDYNDYREVDGEWLAHRLVIRDALGETEVTIRSAVFNEEIPASAFTAQTS
jgi:CubicO group peptidase (beta-lactamase class C family)